MFSAFVKICPDIWLRIFSPKNTFLIKLHKCRKNAKASSITDAKYPISPSVYSGFSI